MLKKDLGALKALKRGEPVMFFGDFDLWVWLGKKRQNSRLGFAGSDDCELYTSHQASGSVANVSHRPPLEKE